MKLLLLDGGVFLGAAVLEAALARGHAVTVFNRGRARSAWPPVAEALTGDRDLGDWMVGLLERGTRGEFNATGPANGPHGTWDDLLRHCAEACAARGLTRARVVRIAEAFITGHGVEPWTELPLWLPSTDPEHRGFARVEVRRALAAGLSTRPLRDTFDAVLGQGVPSADDPRRAGRLDRQREARTIAAWRAR